jgi:hypothetical protein
MPPIVSVSSLTICFLGIPRATHAIKLFGTGRKGGIIVIDVTALAACSIIAGGCSKFGGYNAYAEKKSTHELFRVDMFL